MNESPNPGLRTANCGLRFFIQEIDQEIRAVKKLENENDAVSCLQSISDSDGAVRL